MTSITATTLLAFLAGALLLQMICVNVSASASSAGSQEQG